MEGLICKYCGGNRFEKKETGYECCYCHAVYELASPPIEERQLRHTKKATLKTTLLIVIGVLFSIPFLLAALNTNQLAKAPTKFNMFSPATIPDNTRDSSYSPSELNNPERNVKIAELSLNQENIDLAFASAEEYGGEKKKELKERVEAAQKEHDSLEKKRLKIPPKKDMVISNPNAEFAITTYYRENGFFAAYGPDFDHYSSSDILRIWGQPDEIITDSKQIQENLLISYDEQNNPVNYEARMLREQWQRGELTWREVRAFAIINYDNSYGGYTKLFIYEKQGKPNVYLKEDQVGYITPLVRYVAFNRLPEKYPRAGLGKYPDDFPDNYGSDGLNHEE